MATYVATLQNRLRSTIPTVRGYYFPKSKMDMRFFDKAMHR